MIYCKKKRRWIQLLLMGIILLLFWFLYKNSLKEGLQEISRISSGTKWGLLGASTGYMILEGLIVWNASGAEKQKIRRRDGICCAYYCSFLRLMTFGTGGGIGEVVFLTKKGISAAKATGMSMLQYLLQKTAVAMMGIAAACLYLCRQPERNRYLETYIFFAVLITVGIGAGLALVLFSQTFRNCLMKVLHITGNRFPAIRERELLVQMQMENLQLGGQLLFRDFRRMAWILILNGLKYLCWFSVPYLLYGESAGISLLTSWMLMALATMLAGVIPAPGGYGSIEFVLLLLFSSILRKGQVFSLSVLYRFVTSFCPFFVGAALVGIKKHNHSREEKEHDTEIS